MKILIVSDTHGKLHNLTEVIEREKPIDWLLHLGDVEGQEDEIALLADCRVGIVSGNNDWFTRLSRELELVIGGVRIFMTHGHRYDVYSGADCIKAQGIVRGADVVMFGHTHCPHIERDKESGILILNPGSISCPRQAGRRPSYIIMEIKSDKQIECEIRYL